MSQNNSWVLTGLLPHPTDEWKRLRHFLALSPEEKAAMVTTIEPLFQRGHELVVGTYDYLAHHEETAVILGWEKGVDPAHLAERRRFFTIWLARLLGMDFSDDFALALFRAGQVHAAHGPRHIHVPEVYVSGAISLVSATFARFLQEEMPGETAVPTALAGWHKVLTLHQHMMLFGYQTARDWDAGEAAVCLQFYGRMRDYTGTKKRTIQLKPGSTAADLLRKFFNYYPTTRADVFTTIWQPAERLDERGNPWLTPEPAYQAKKGWRVLVNGRNITHTNGLHQAIPPDSTICIFPPGR